MDDLEQLQLLYISPQQHFTLFQAHAKKLDKTVTLQSCNFSEPSDCEPYLKHHLKLTQNQQFAAPLVAIFPHFQEDTQQVTLNFVWERAEMGLDPEITRECMPQSSVGKQGFGDKKTIFTNQHTGVKVKEAFSESLGELVLLKEFTSSDLGGLSDAFSEALEQASSSHPNICNLLDVCFFRTKIGSLRLFFVMEKFENDLETLIREQPMRQEEMWQMLMDVSEGLLCLKAHVSCT